MVFLAENGSLIVAMSQFLFIFFLLVAPVSQSDAAYAPMISSADTSGVASLQVTVRNVPEREGTVRLAIFDSESTWLEEPVFTTIVSADDKTVVYEFDSIPEGDYGIAAFHDQNGNERLDRNILGIPREAYGFSNNVKPMFGPCSWDEARVSLKTETLKVVIEL